MQRPKKRWLTILLTLFILFLLTGVGFLGWQTYELTNIKILNEAKIAQLQQTLAKANDKILATEEEIQKLSAEYEELRDEYRDERDKNEEFEDRIDDLAGTIGTLDKLSKTDKQLLQKYSKVYFLNENYVPESLKKIDEDYILEGRDDQYFHGKAIDRLEDLLKDAERDDIDLKVISAYRSFDQQAQLKGQYTQTYGTGANTFSADQGYSEHQLGTTVDLTVEEVGGAYTSFGNTEAFEWLQDNAYKHGFILSYPEGNDYYVYEPWHWRFVGEDLARDLDRRDDNFYDLEQRQIDEYLITLFD